MISNLPHRLGLAGAGVLLASVLAPNAVLAQPYPGYLPPGGAFSPWGVPNGGPPTAGVDYRPVYVPSDGNPSDGNSCLRASALSGVVASNDREVILRFGGSTFYRARLTGACPSLTQPGAHVAGVARYLPAVICRPSDVKLKVVSGNGAVSRCAAETLDMMTAAQVNAASEPVNH